MTRLGNNLSGQYKRGVGMALQIGIGNFSGAIASNIYRSQDSPRYVLGRTASLSIMPALQADLGVDALEFIFITIGFVIIPLLVFTYTRINARRARAVANGEQKAFSVEQLRAMGDRSPEFRYTL